MKESIIHCGGTETRLFSSEKPEVLLLEPIDRNDLDFLDREQADILNVQGITNTLEWNPGNHFKGTDLRTAKAFLWAMDLT
ncbi:MAG: hypothetical protein J6M31_08670 [Bacteroidales bacterium]|nr:hypothetical protein [Bacteroidales bacterium]